MRHTAAAIGLTAALLLAPAAPAFAEAGTTTGQASVVNASTADRNNADDDSSSGGWGLWGLAGLLGLAGLVPRNKKKGPDVPPRTHGGPTTGSHPTEPRI